MAADNRKTALLDLAKFCEGIIPHPVHGAEASLDDAQELGNDMLLLARKVDAVFQAYASFSDSVIGLSESDQKLFHSPTENAIEGDACFVIRSAVEDRIEARRDDYADYRRQQMRDDALVGG